jgi:hypothetical protein
MHWPTTSTLTIDTHIDPQTEITNISIRRHSDNEIATVLVMMLSQHRWTVLSELIQMMQVVTTLRCVLTLTSSMKSLIVVIRGITLTSFCNEHASRAILLHHHHQGVV